MYHNITMTVSRGHNDSHYLWVWSAQMFTDSVSVVTSSWRTSVWPWPDTVFTTDTYTYTTAFWLGLSIGFSPEWVIKSNQTRHTSSQLVKVVLTWTLTLQVRRLSTGTLVQCSSSWRLVTTACNHWQTTRDVRSLTGLVDREGSGLTIDQSGPERQRSRDVELSTDWIQFSHKSLSMSMFQTAVFHTALRTWPPATYITRLSVCLSSQPCCFTHCDSTTDARPSVLWPTCRVFIHSIGCFTNFVTTLEDTAYTTCSQRQIQQQTTTASHNKLCYLSPHLADDNTITRSLHKNYLNYGLTIITVLYL